ncbi:C2 NT-type domain-containing protein [Heracleum sosnowskyi]|uniref:C2 NT-type domain-containing protein n=1 Tax=Heracleum sosnowskyi TaxID=360622 RepID=A0AAD8JHM9_9APIA|nr:C2 NT-type domain-containing protein [Heracleum sosnowskyi]
MGVKMMRWRPWPPLVSKKFQVKLVVKSLEGWCGDLLHACAQKQCHRRVAVEIKWKGPKIALSSLRRTVKRNVTKQEALDSNGVVLWGQQEFSNVCTLSGIKDTIFHPWEISFTVLNGSNLGAKNKSSAVGTATLNLAEYACAAEGEEFELTIPLIVSGTAAEPHPSLHITLALVEQRIAQEPVHSDLKPGVLIASPLPAGDNSSSEKDELSALKAGLRKVRIFTEYVSTRRAKKVCLEEEGGSDGRYSARSEEGDYTYPFDSESFDELEEGESDEIKEDPTVRKSFSYGTLASANCVGSVYSNMKNNCEDEDWVYYSNRKSDVGCLKVEDTQASIPGQSVCVNSRRSILPWKKRKMSFRSPKARGEPLLKKDNGEEGGDDIDFDRRQLSSDESLSFWWQKTDEESCANCSSVSEFGDDSFAIGNWEQKEILSRDGHMKLQTQVFFASIDQRSERAAGESACTVLVAVVADWLQNNHDIMPIKSQFDSLIREGSLEWRNLCENETYRERFPDKHFDLETVLQAKIRSLSVVPRKSFIGFFHPDGMGEERFDFLHGAMTFDSIWDEISHAELECSSSGEPQIYIVSWNDHFFVLRVEAEAYYIIDTLGERLYEGCNQAYILKFDKNTTIHRLPGNTAQLLEPNSTGDQQQIVASAPVHKNQQVVTKDNSAEKAEEKNPTEIVNNDKEEVVCQGKESCKEYIKNFLAAIPIRELQADLKKGLIASTPLHHRLQIEIHYTQSQIPPGPENSDLEIVMPENMLSLPVPYITVADVAA